MDFIGDGLNERDEEGRSGDAVGLFDELYEGKLRRAIYGDEKIELSFRCLHLGDVDMKEADRVGLELLL
jgi:hypothetical protein